MCVRSLRKAAWVCLLISVLAPKAAAGNRGREVVVVRSTDSAQYRAVEQGFSLAVGSIKSLSLADPGASTDLKPLLERAALVFAVGPEAFKAVSAAQTGGGAALFVARINEGEGASAAVSVPIFVPAAQQIAAINRFLPSVRDVPRRPRLGILFDPSISSSLVVEYERAAEAAGFTLLKMAVKRREEVAETARELIAKVEAIWLIPDATVVSPETFKFLVQLSFANKVPLIGLSEGMAKAGAVLAVQPDYPEIGRRGGAAAKRVLDGQPAAFEAPAATVFLNSKAAEILEIDLPQSERAAAAKVFD